MKSLFVSILFSVGLGYGIASLLESRRTSGLTHIYGTVDDIDGTLKKFDKPAPVEEKSGRIEVVGGNEFDFGTMKEGAKRSHKFTFKNVGEAPVDIWYIRSTCKCTVGKLERAKLVPGESTDVELTWELKGQDTFSQTATIGSTAKGQEEIPLVIRGKIGQSYVFDPPNLVIGDHLSHDDLVFEGQLYCLEEVQMTFDDGRIANASFSDKILCEVQPVRSLTDEELKRYPDAKSVLDYKVTVKKGIGAANLNSVINFRSLRKPDMDPASVPISGRILTPVRLIAGGDFNEERRLLKLGIASSKDGLKKSIMMAVSTEQYPDAEITYKEIEPPELEGKVVVTVKPPSTRGKQKIYPVVIELPPGTPPIEKNAAAVKDFAKIIFNTNMENSPTEAIYLQFRITE